MQHLKNSKYVVLVFTAFAALALVFAGCSGSGDGDNGAVDGMGTARVVLTDAPLSDVQEVHVHIVRIDVVRSGEGVRTLLTDEEIPDDIELIELARNPLLLGEPLIPAGQYTQVRLILSDAPGANYIIDGDGVRHDLTVPSGAQTGAKLVTGAFTVERGEVITILLDFHAAASVHRAGQSGMWIMRPTIFASVLSDADLNFGMIRGTVLDTEGQPLPVPANRVLGVFVETPFGPISVGEVDPDDGSYEIPSILAGTYDIRVRYADPEGWEPVGDPLDIVVNGAIQQLINIVVGADDELTVNIFVDLD